MKLDLALAAFIGALCIIGYVSLFGKGHLYAPLAPTQHIVTSRP